MAAVTTKTVYETVTTTMHPSTEATDAPAREPPTGLPRTHNSSLFHRLSQWFRLVESDKWRSSGFGVRRRGQICDARGGYLKHGK